MKMREKDVKIILKKVKAAKNRSESKSKMDIHTKYLLNTSKLKFSQNFLHNII